MAQKIITIIDERIVEWEMSSWYDLKNTAFIWVQDEETIHELSLELIPERPRGWNPPKGTVHGPTKLYILKPIGMLDLPEWCRVKRHFDIRKGDTHEWMLIERASRMEEYLYTIGKPIALSYESSEWHLFFEDDNPRISYQQLCLSNLLNYGLSDAANNLEFKPL